MTIDPDGEDKDLYSGLIRLHILHHAVEEGRVYGLWMIEELARHGYRISAGTVYPLLHSLERKGYLRSASEQHEGRVRRMYRATSAGARALDAAKKRVWELFGELFEQQKLARRSTPSRHSESKSPSPRKRR